MQFDNVPSARDEVTSNKSFLSLHPGINAAVAAQHSNDVCTQLLQRWCQTSQGRWISGKGRVHSTKGFRMVATCMVYPGNREA